MFWYVAIATTELDNDGPELADAVAYVTVLAAAILDKLLFNNDGAIAKLDKCTSIEPVNTKEERVQRG